MLKGLLASGITMGVAAVFPEALVFPFFAAVLGLMTGIYPGLALAEGTVASAGMEWTVGLAIFLAGLVGLWMSPLVLAGAWLAHGLWAGLHGLTGLGKGMPEGLPGFSLSYALVTASFVAYMWAAAG